MVRVHNHAQDDIGSATDYVITYFSNRPTEGGDAAAVSVAAGEVAGVESLPPTAVEGLPPTAVASEEAPMEVRIEAIDDQGRAVAIDVTQDTEKLLGFLG